MVDNSHFIWFCDKGPNYGFNLSKYTITVGFFDYDWYIPEEKKSEPQAIAITEEQFDAADRKSSKAQALFHGDRMELMKKELGFK